MSLPPQLEADIEALRAEGLSVTASRDPSNASRIFIVFDQHPLPTGWNKKETQLLLITDVSYPNSKLDMFWVDPDLLLDGNKAPQAGDAIESYLDKQWRRLSWHVQNWNPAIDNVRTYLDTVNARLRQRQ